MGRASDERGAYGIIGPRTKQYSKYKNSVNDLWNTKENVTRWRIKRDSVIIEGPNSAKINRDGELLPGGGGQMLIIDKFNLINPIRK